MIEESDNKLAYSVLMSVYYKEKPEFLREAMESIWRQTSATDDFVLVCDGPLTEELNAVITDMQSKHVDDLHVIKLEMNTGLGNALNIGIQYCKNDLVARMDSDDISRQDRCEKQLIVFRDKPEISVCSGIIEEFTKDVSCINSRRVPPESNQAIMSFAKWRNPFNHPCVMYKKSAVEAAGGYKDFYLLEDYYLWVRMLQNEMQGYNIQEPLLWMRAGSDMYKRRAGWKYVKSQNSLFKYMWKSGYISGIQYIISMFVRILSTCMPNGIRTRIFKMFMRR